MSPVELSSRIHQHVEDAETRLCGSEQIDRFFLTGRKLAEMVCSCYEIFVFTTVSLQRDSRVIGNASRDIIPPVYSRNFPTCYLSNNRSICHSDCKQFVPIMVYGFY